MNIGVFQPQGEHWLLVIGLRLFMPQDPSSESFRMTYDGHWTMNNTWSKTEPAMTFGTREDAESYLRSNRDWMKRADFEN